MMGMQQEPQSSLFYIGINIDKRVREDHFLRRVKQLIDFDFSYEEVKDLYGDNGNVSVPPPVILKLMLLLVLYNVRSERELMDTVPERIDWLWFLGYDLDSEIPNHSVLSKARKKWGVEVDALVDDDDFKAKLEKHRTTKANSLATSNIRGSAGETQAKNTPEYWISKGAPPSRTDVPDRKTRATIVRAMMKNASTDGKKFYND